MPVADTSRCMSISTLAEVRAIIFQDAMFAAYSGAFQIAAFQTWNSPPAGVLPKTQNFKGMQRLLITDNEQGCVFCCRGVHICNRGIKSHLVLIKAPAYFYIIGVWKDINLSTHTYGPLTSEDSQRVGRKRRTMPSRIFFKAQETLNFSMPATVLCGWPEICKISDVSGPSAGMVSLNACRLCRVAHPMKKQ